MNHILLAISRMNVERARKQLIIKLRVWVWNMEKDLRWWSPMLIQQPSVFVDSDRQVSKLFVKHLMMSAISWQLLSILNSIFLNVLCKLRLRPNELKNLLAFTCIISIQIISWRRKNTHLLFHRKKNVLLNYFLPSNPWI